MNSTGSSRSIIICFLTCKNSFPKVFIPSCFCSFLRLISMPRGLVPTFDRATGTFPGRLQQTEAARAQLAGENGPQMFEEHTANIRPCRQYWQQISGGDWARLHLPRSRRTAGRRQGRSRPFICTFGSPVPTCSLHLPRCLSSKEH